MTGPNVRTIEGVVLRTYPSGDSDLVLRILTDGEGKVSAIARHARKSKRRFGNNFDIFDRGRFELKMGRGSLGNVQSFIPLGSWPALRASLEKLSAASLICECFDFVVKEQVEPDLEIYETLNLGLSAISEAKVVKEIMRATFLALARLLILSGFHDGAGDERPSFNRLVHLLNLVEYHAERALESRATFLDLGKQIKQSQDDEAPAS